jgi:hypothetical protein
MTALEAARFPESGSPSKPAPTTKRIEASRLTSRSPWDRLPVKAYSTKSANVRVSPNTPKALDDILSLAGLELKEQNAAKLRLILGFRAV